jgi:hypothetical protein
MINSRGQMSTKHYKTLHRYSVHIQHYFEYPRPLLDETGSVALLTKPELTDVLQSLNELFMYAYPSVPPEASMHEWWRTESC